MISPEHEALIGQVFEDYLAQHHQEDLLQLLADTSGERHRAVPVNAMTLFEANMEVTVMGMAHGSIAATLNAWFLLFLQVADFLNAYPSDVLAIFDKVLRSTALKLSEKLFPSRSSRDMRCFPHTRITGETPVMKDFSSLSHQPRQTHPASRQET